ncbi:hypothetical protein WN55_07194 [Dufourea novaeangliae]|uniref:Nucleic-acid-binding protein from transposon X-element n=1 Tax=Dufourea novaeangliae TaxID=178035 RepID=A0A154PSG7_DUFNO|nr:hypothetical protein WN55_07194 [Dufourea novaeangliae]
MPTSNTYSVLTEEDNIPTDNTNTTETAKPPPIYIEAQMIESLTELLEHQAGKNNFTLKQLKDNQIKVQLPTPVLYRQIVNALKSKNANFYTYQTKTDRSYKTILCGIHPKTNTHKIVEELKQYNHTVKTIKNINPTPTPTPNHDQHLNTSSRTYAQATASETHFTIENHVRIPHYTIYDTKHPSGKAHGGTAIIIKNNIKHHLHSNTKYDYLQVTTVTIETTNGEIRGLIKKFQDCLNCAATEGRSVVQLF